MMAYIAFLDFLQLLTKTLSFYLGYIVIKVQVVPCHPVYLEGVANKRAVADLALSCISSWRPCEHLNSGNTWASCRGSDVPGFGDGASVDVNGMDFSANYAGRSLAATIRWRFSLLVCGSFPLSRMK